jgi:hypothetical protein
LDALRKIVTIRAIGTDRRTVARDKTTAVTAEAPIGRRVAQELRAVNADLRRFLVQRIENHIERRLITVPTLEAV